MELVVQLSVIKATFESEWSLFRIQDLGDCVGTCACGKKWVRYYYYIKNNANQSYACLCPDCIQILPRIAAVAELLHVFFYGITATFVCNGENGNHVFAVNKSFSFFQRRNEIAQEFKAIPIHHYRKAAIVVVQHQSKYRFKPNVYYEIKIRPVIRMHALTFELIASEQFPDVGSGKEAGTFTVSPPPSEPPPFNNPVLPINFYLKKTPVYCTI